MCRPGGPVPPTHLCLSPVSSEPLLRVSLQRLEWQFFIHSELSCSLGCVPGFSVLTCWSVSLCQRPLCGDGSGLYSGTGTTLPYAAFPETSCLPFSLSPCSLGHPLSAPGGLGSPKGPVLAAEAHVPALLCADQQLESEVLPLCLLPGCGQWKLKLLASGS